MRQSGGSLRIDDFYIEKKGSMSISELRERMQALKFPELGINLAVSKAIDVKFKDAVPSSLLASLALSRALDRISAERVLAQSFV